MGLWSSRREISISDLSLICYASTPQILMHTVANRYAIAEKGEDNVVTSNTPFTILPFFIDFLS